MPDGGYNGEFCEGGYHSNDYDDFKAAFAAYRKPDPTYVATRPSYKHDITLQEDPVVLNPEALRTKPQPQVPAKADEPFASPDTPPLNNEPTHGHELPRPELSPTLSVNSEGRLIEKRITEPALKL